MRDLSLVQALQVLRGVAPVPSLSSSRSGCGSCRPTPGAPKKNPPGGAGSGPIKREGLHLQLSRAERPPRRV
jgi:hypothetical protein